MGGWDFGKALSLDGDDDYMIVDGASLPAEDMTLMFWMKSSDEEHGTPISYASSSKDNEFTIFDYGDFVLYRQGKNTGAIGVSANDGNWHHIAVTWDQTIGQFKLFKDGVSAYFSSPLPGSLLAQPGTLVFGQEQDPVSGDPPNHDPNQAFKGLIDEIALYEKVLSPAEVSQAYDYVLLGEGDPVVDGLVSYWSFDVFTAVDSVGTYDGTLMNGASWARGISGYALSLDGADDYVHVPASLPAEDMTLTFWIKSSNSDPSNFGTPVSYAVGESDNEFTLYDHKSFDLHRQDRQEGGRTGPTGVSVNDNQWHYIAVTWDHGSSDCLDGEGKFEVFKDGERASFSPSSTACLPGSALKQDGTLVFGQEQDSEGGGFNPVQAFEGLIDEVAVYDRVLSAEEIRQIYRDFAPALSFVTATPACFPDSKETNPFHYGNHDVFVHNGFAYIASKNNWYLDGKTSLDILDVTDPENPSLATRVPVSSYPELFGINEVVVKRGTSEFPNETFAYVVADANEGRGAFSIWNVSDPYNVTRADFVRNEGSDHYLDYAHGISVQGDYAYVASMGARTAKADSSLAIFDVSDPYNIVEKSVLRKADEDAIPGAAVDIAVDGDRAYIIGYNGSGWPAGESKVTVVDISDPANPAIVSSIIEEADAEPPLYLGAAHRIEKMGDCVYIVSRGTTPALTIFDVSNVDENNAPDHKGAITGAGAPNFLSGAAGLAVTSRYAFVASAGVHWGENSETGALSVFDISNPADPTLVDVWCGGGPPYFLENAYNVFVDGDYVYVSANSENSTIVGEATGLGGGLSIFKTNIPGSLNSRLQPRVFYNNSAFDGNNPAANQQDDSAIATDKTALLPGETARGDNFTSYGRGINGIIVDIRSLPVESMLGENDFEFKFGNDNNPSTWETAPPLLYPPAVRSGIDQDGSDRVSLIWADYAIPTRNWLQVRVKATENTGLDQDEVFYFGNVIGDTDGDRVAACADMYAIYQQLGQPANVENPLDIDRDGEIAQADMDAVFSEAGRLSVLNLITVPSVVATDDAATTDEDTITDIAVLGNDRDVDGNPLSVAAADDTSALGASVTINLDGTLTYDPTGSVTLQALASGETMEDTFSYTISDVRGGTDTGTVTVTVSGVDEPPEGESIEPVGLDSLADDPAPLAMNLSISGEDATGMTSASAHDAAMKEAAEQKSPERSLVRWDWLWWYDFEQTRLKKRSAKTDSLAEAAADEFLAAWQA